MKHFEVDDDLAALVWERAKPEPFENLSFSAALRRVLVNTSAKHIQIKKLNLSEVDVDQLFAELDALGKLTNHEVTKRKRAKSPDASEWITKIPALKSKNSGASRLKSWADICTHLGIQVGRDSARRKLGEWVKLNKPAWPPVPDIKTKHKGQ